MPRAKKVKVEIEKPEGNEVTEINQEAFEQKIEIKKVSVEKARIKVVGDSPLLVHAWSEKARKEMLESMQLTKQQKKEREREPKDPFADFVEAAYWITPMPNVRGLPEEKQIELFEKAIDEGAEFGFPVISFKKAAMQVCRDLQYVKSPKLLSKLITFHAVNPKKSGNSAVEIAPLAITEPPELSEEVVQIGFPKKPDLRYRPVYKQWSTELEISLIQTGIFSLADVVNIIDIAGHMNGIGEWRKERDGEFGAFHVQLEGEE